MMFILSGFGYGVNAHKMFSLSPCTQCKSEEQYQNIITYQDCWINFRGSSGRSRTDIFTSRKFSDDYDLEAMQVDGIYRLFSTFHYYLLLLQISIFNEELFFMQRCFVFNYNENGNTKTMLKLLSKLPYPGVIVQKIEDINH